ncbi:HNH endonuclease [Methylomonas methanica]|uniref:HNH nuclease domain-containing protein n=1 Tax=Methylomonas methanica (strain DSM 25384 / MC09) TaxID=857087 RepID=G0A053_METMM|nr:HNH endonuclease [Methylomonas methanica]AEG01192.1 hypothetical protein Metme_2810 [Methylomonas methanica MC09]
MNILKRALIEKTGHENGFENILSSHDDGVLLGSALHGIQALIAEDNYRWIVDIHSEVSKYLYSELTRCFPNATRPDRKFVLLQINDLAIFLRRASKLAQSLPNQLAVDYDKQVTEELTHFADAETKATEIERIVRQRIGQQKFRDGMLQYWGGACAVTGVDVTEVLRASHAKPWAECKSDTERLDVFNGFLLCAHLDALFDRFLISFDDKGQMLISPKLSQNQRDILGLNDDLCLRWIADRHLLYLDYHRAKFFDLQGG